MTNHRDEPADGADERRDASGGADAGGPSDTGAGPGREPGREAPSGRPAGAGPSSGRTPGDAEPGDTGRTGGGGPGSARSESTAEDAEEASGDDGGGEKADERAGRGRRGARRSWGDAFSEVQDLVGDVVGDVLEGVKDAAASRFPRMDLVRVEGEGYRLLIDLPGLTREDVEVLTLGNELTIRGERPRPELPEGSEILRSERAHGRFERTIRMPPEVREEGVAASFQDGVLTVRLPHSEPSDARTVDIG